LLEVANLIAVVGGDTQPTRYVREPDAITVVSYLQVLSQMSLANTALIKRLDLKDYTVIFVIMLKKEW